MQSSRGKNVSEALTHLDWLVGGRFDQREWPQSA
jgi:hypothetical protein